MIRSLQKRWRPESFQGSLSGRSYFEGWYYKIVDRGENSVIAIIPGVSLGEESTHSFIQVLDGTRQTYDYYRYGIDEFKYSRDEFRIEVGNSTFTTDRIELQVQGREGIISGELSFNDLRPWPGRLWSPGSMGALGLVPGIPCYHHVLSLDHRVSGQISVGDRILDFEGGRGYTEKSWGRSFPRRWIWVQSNHFEQPGTCFILAFARMNLHSRPISGLTCGLFREKQHFEFCTWSGGRVTEMNVGERKVNIVLENPRNKLELEAIQAATTKMLVPHIGGMTGSVFESLTSLVKFALLDKKGDTTLLEGTGRCAGVEFSDGGDGSRGDV